MEVQSLYKRAVSLYQEEGLGGLCRSIPGKILLSLKDLYADFYLSFLRRKNKSNVILVNVLGNKMFVDLRNNRIGFHLVKYGIWEPDTVKWLNEFLHLGMKVLDIGANIGYFALIEAKIVGNSGKVYAVEPDPRNLELLRKNVQINNLHNVELFDCAISNRSGVENFYLSKTSSHNSLLPISKKLGELKVRAYTVDDFLKENGIGWIDAIRMDVEGAEGKIIDGASLTLEKAEVIFVEIHPQLIRLTGYSTKWIFEKLKCYGFVLARKGKNHVFVKKR